MRMTSVPMPNSALATGSGTAVMVYRLAAVPNVVPDASVAES